MRIHTVARTYILTFKPSGHSYPLTSDEAQRLVDNYPAVRATRNRVTLRADDGQHTTLLPATVGGGPAFTITR